MAEYTENFNLEKQKGNDYVNIEGLNDNFDIIDSGLKEVKDKADQAFQSASNGKTLIKNAITGVDKDVSVPTDATFAELAAAIGQIQTGVDTEDATSTAEQILTGMTAYVKGVKVTGNMTNRGAVNFTPGTANQAILKGYHNGNGMVVGDPNLVAGNIKAGVSIFGKSGKSSVVDTADANVTAGQMLTGYSGYVNGSKINGGIPMTMPDYWDQIPAMGISHGTSGGDGQNYAYMQIPNGQFLNGVNWVRHIEPDLIPQNILSGKSIMGVSGSAVSGKRSQSSTSMSSASTLSFVTGEGKVYSTYSFTASGLTFIPSYIIAFNNSPETSVHYSFYKYDGFGLTAHTDVLIQIGLWFSNAMSGAQAGIRLDGTAAYVNSTSFRLPILFSGQSINWIAIE